MRTTLTAVAACLALALAACGGGDDDDGETEFLSQVNAICADYGPKLALIPPPAEDIDEWAAIGADLADLLEASVNELRLLEPPESLADEFARWLGLRTSMSTSMRDVQTAGAQHNEAAVTTELGTIGDAIAEADPLAEELGFDECSPTGLTISA